ncbi:MULTISPECIES: glutathione S-transferase family protein [Candidatus Ichthyocystis]|uniref:glutathione S-transferase family protein n=1 Tax=Candidatus Ichthyocystis TaxID=2929841 RepID=UPI000B80EA6A|nr:MULTISPECIES: glutathione S-transferase family protein [Ichthyocystis]
MIEICSEGFPLDTAIALEELFVPYKVIERMRGSKSLPPIDYGQSYIVDTTPSGSIEHVCVYGSCAILEYLSDKYRMLVPDDSFDFLDTKQWLYWYCSYLEPFVPGIMGLAPPAEKRILLDRFSKLNQHLEKKRFFARSYSIADIVFYPAYKLLRQSHPEQMQLFSNLEEWTEAIEKRPAAARALEKAIAFSH